MGGELYLHKKTGNIYRKLCDATDTTNIRNGQSVVFYRIASLQFPAEYFVRQTDEFNEKFELLHKKG